MAAVVQKNQRAVVRCHEEHCRRDMLFSFVVIFVLGLLLFAVNCFFFQSEKITWERIVYSAVSLCLVMATYFQGFRMPWAVGVDQAAKQANDEPADNNRVEVAT